MLKESNPMPSPAGAGENEGGKNLKEVLLMAPKLFSFLLKRWYILTTFGLIGGSIGFLLAWMSPVTYTANVKFVLEEGKSGGLGLSSIVGSLGIDMGSMSGNMLAGDNIIGLLKSRRFTREVLTTNYDQNNGLTLADKYAEQYGLRESWKKSKSIGRDIFFPANEAKQRYSRLQDSLLQLIERRILNEQLSVQRPDKKMTFFSVSATFRDDMLSKLFVERLVASVIDFYIETKTRRLRTNVNRLQSRADSLLRTLNSRTFSAAVAQSQTLDVNPAYQTAAVALETGIRDKTVVGTVYTEVVKNLEIQKLTLTQETPTIQIVDDAQLPLMLNRKSRTMNFIGFGILAIFLAAGWLIGKRYLSKR